nr:hypothetical protein CFP56_60312 [Quercus suber]
MGRAKLMLMLFLGKFWSWRSKYLLRVGNTFTCNVEAELHEIEIESIDLTRKAEDAEEFTIIMTILYCQGSTLEVQILPLELLLGLGFVKRGETEQKAVSTGLQPPLDSGTTAVLLILFCNKSS